MSITKEKLDELEGLRSATDAALAFDADGHIRPCDGAGNYVVALVNAAPALIAAARKVSRGTGFATPDHHTVAEYLGEDDTAREADTLRAQLREVTAERDAAQYLAGRRGADLDVLRAQLRDVTAQRNRYQRLFEGRCLECNNLSPVHAPGCSHVTGEAAR